jgi:hypothetical protein
MLLKKFEMIENTLFFKKKLWVSESDQLKLNIIRKIHDQSASKHSNIRRTCKYLHKWYYWSQAKQSVKRYIRNCHICKRFKATRDKYSDLLNFLSISNRSWMNIIMNFVIELSESKEFNAILMIVDRLTKMHHYISCTTTKEDTSAEKIARLLINHVWKLHELRLGMIRFGSVFAIWEPNRCRFDFLPNRFRIDLIRFDFLSIRNRWKSEVRNSAY